MALSRSRQLVQTAPAVGRIRNGPKVPCPSCGAWLSEVVAGYPLTDDSESYRRRRKCAQCTATFFTVERVEGVAVQNAADGDG
jgi:hypothetical protein